MSQDPTEWFDQFPPLAESTVWADDSQWCPRHWAPCPILGADGFLASLELMGIFLQEMATADNNAGLNAEMQAIGKICCTLGDKRMYEIWGKCPPNDQSNEERN